MIFSNLLLWLETIVTIILENWFPNLIHIKCIEFILNNKGRSGQIRETSTDQNRFSSYLVKKLVLEEVHLQQNIKYKQKERRVTKATQAQNQANKTTKNISYLTINLV